MAGKAYGIIIGDGLFKVLGIADVYTIPMRMAFPATEFIRVCQVVHTLKIFLLDFLELVMGIILVVCMAINTGPGFLQPGFQWMRPILIIRGMTVKAGKTLVVRVIVIITLYHVIRTHMPCVRPVIFLFR
jgi:hypothetical protein